MTTMNNYNIFKFERELVFDATLKLIKAGKFQNTSLREIAHHANLAESTIDYVFESREMLIIELTQYLGECIAEVTRESLAENGTFKEKFFKTWKGLFDYYSANPDVIAFFEQSQSLPAFSKNQHAEEDFIAALIGFFEREMPGSNDKFSPASLALLFHGNVLTVAKIELKRGARFSAHEVKNLIGILWAGYEIHYDAPLINAKSLIYKG
jgi:AcrR family transcriptional regulator